MDVSPSIRSCSRARTNERGIALAIALIVAVLYFGLIELMLYDASRELAEARRFRARIIALTLAENGAELAARDLVNVPSDPAPMTDWQGTISGDVAKSGDKTSPEGETFKINGTGDATGIVEAHATVYIQGRIDAAGIHIDYTRHSQ
jgi:hypothetical protein